ncbi:MAG: type-F conjugative transfer system secretin TraK [Chlamydiia bacterium]|nr:type-F conjugative transfer system secretin TraK [Chlamydiia bacterium]
MKSPGKFINAFLLLICAGSVPLTALVEEPIDPKSALEVTLSTTAPNRIMFEGGSIVDVVLDENKFQSFLHQKTGQAFLTPLNEMKEHPTSVTIMTSSGDAQTLSILAEPGPGEIIVLKEKQNEPSKREELSSDYHSPTVDFLNNVLWGNIPHGYGVRALEEATFSIEVPFKTRPLRLLEGPFEEILVIEVTNHSKKVETLNPSTLKRQNDLWVFLSKTHLEPGEKTLAIVSTKKEL